MFEWYQEAEVCLVFLPDMPSPGDIGRDLPRCRWFTRGWTLQELLAPGAVWFFDSAWEFMGEKRDRALRHLISDITAIPESLLVGSVGLSDYSNSVRMSWAANHQTTRVEDIAYCLMGIFDIKMPLIYGEGKKAFQRLQEEIVKSSGDASIFAWTGKADGWEAPLYSGIYAESPAQFEHSDHPPLRDAIVHGISVTNRGIHIRISLGVSYSTAKANTYTYVLRLGRVYDARGHPTTLGIYLRQVGPGKIRNQPTLQVLDRGYLHRHCHPAKCLTTFGWGLHRTHLYQLHQLPWLCPQISTIQQHDAYRLLPGTKLGHARPMLFYQLTQRSRLGHVLRFRAGPGRSSLVSRGGGPEPDVHMFQLQRGDRDKPYSGPDHQPRHAQRPIASDDALVPERCRCRAGGKRSYHARAGGCCS